jgi:hypothetical protein
VITEVYKKIMISFTYQQTSMNDICFPYISRFFYCNFLNVNYFSTSNYTGVMALRLHLLPYDVHWWISVVNITNQFLWYHGLQHEEDFLRWKYDVYIANLTMLRAWRILIIKFLNEISLDNIWKCLYFFQYWKNIFFHYYC